MLRQQWRRLHGGADGGEGSAGMEVGQPEWWRWGGDGGLLDSSDLLRFDVTRAEIDTNQEEWSCSSCNSRNSHSPRSKAAAWLATAAAAAAAFAASVAKILYGTPYNPKEVPGGCLFAEKAAA